jgi:hypothetical protein
MRRRRRGFLRDRKAAEDDERGEKRDVTMKLLHT